MEERTAEARDSYPSIDQIRGLDTRLKYLTHDARRVIDRSKMLDDLNLYLQVQLIQECCNHSAGRVLDALRPSIKIKPPKDPKKREKYREEAARNEVTGETILETKELFKNPLTLRAFLENGLNKKALGKPHNEAHFTSKAIWNLYLIDSLMLAADYSVRVENLASYLDRISVSTIEGIASDMGHTRMAFVLAEIEEYFGVVEEAGRTLAEVEEVVIEPTTPVDPASQQSFQKALSYLEGAKEEDE